MAGRSIAISAGEASGDLNGALIASELARLVDEAVIWGAGGPRMAEAGVRIAANTTGGGTIGILETFRSLPLVAARYFAMRSALLRRRPDVFVPIDFGAFNLRLGQIAHAAGIPVVYYFPPSSWRRRSSSAAKLAACGGKVITPFPWSAEVLTAEGVDARFVGHPLLDTVKPAVERAELLRELGLSERLPTIGLLPGSRAHELREHVRPMFRAAGLIARELGGAQFIVAAVAGVEWIRGQVSAAEARDASLPPIRVVENRTYDCMAASDLLICKSGTATLEAAIIGTPMVIVYRGTPIMRLEYKVRKSALEEHIGMPNIVADRGVCPELLNEQVTAERVADLSLSLLTDPAKLAAMRRELAEVRSKLGEPGATARAARLVIEMGGLA